MEGPRTSAQLAASAYAVNARAVSGPTARAALRTIAFIALLLVLQVAILFPLLPSRLHVHEGDIASQTVRAPREFTYSSDVLRRQEQDKARNSVPDSYSYNVNVKNEQLAHLSDIATRISVTRVDTTLTLQQRIDALSARGPALTLEQRAAIVTFTPEEWRQTVDEATRLLGAVLEEPFAAAELTTRLASLPNRVSAGLTATQGDVGVALVRELIVPTERLDVTSTQRNRDQAAAAVPPRPQTFARNQVIVREGDAIDASKLEALQNAGLLTVKLRYNDLGAVLLLSLTISCALAAFLRVFYPAIILATRRALLLAVILAGIVLLAKVYMPLVLPDSRRQLLQFAFPAAAVPMLVASLFDVGLAIVVAGLSSLLVTFTALYLPDLSGVVGLTALQPLEMASAFFIGGLAGVLVVYRAERFNRFLAAGVAVALATAAVLAGYALLDSARRPQDIGWLFLASGINGIVSSLLTVGTFVLLGAVFNISTRLQLMELAQLNQPLLRRLQEEAPGTFHHSILVGNLGERAADLIGADALLVRVGCYYHDIGKLSRPGFFIENQMGGANPHDDLDPLVSNSIVQEHVRYGAELARKHHLPERVRDFCIEHHGSRLVAYFYRRAAESDPDIDPALFTYPGPKPRSRETAIAMLSDSTEAIVRASRDHSFEHIDNLVESVISERLAEGQFDHCDLTLRDLRTIAESFKSTLRAIYHPRIEYPEPTAAEKRRRSGQHAAGGGAPQSRSTAATVLQAQSTGQGDYRQPTERTPLLLARRPVGPDVSTATSAEAPPPVDATATDPGPQASSDGEGASPPAPLLPAACGPSPEDDVGSPTPERAVPELTTAAEPQAPDHRSDELARTDLGVSGAAGAGNGHAWADAPGVADSEEAERAITAASSRSDP